MQKFFSITRWAGAKRLLSVMFFLCCTFWAMGQTATLQKKEITPNTSCHSNGAVKITVNNPGHLNLTYQLLFNNAIQSQNITGEFSGLNAGSYVLRVSKTENGQKQFEEPIDIPEKYVPLTKTKPTVSVIGLCTQYKPGAKIKVDPTSIHGGTEPFQYILVKTDQYGFDDAGETYVTGKTEFDVTEFGTYMLRIKDACGEKITVKADVTRTLSPVRIRAGVEYSETCASGQAQLKAITFYDINKNSALDGTNYFAAGGVKLEMYAATADGKNKLNEEKLYDGTIKHANNTTVGVRTGYLFKLSPTNLYWSKVTTPCGDVYEGPVLNLKTAETSLHLRAISSGCTAEGEETMVISNTDYTPFFAPGVVHFKNVASGKVLQKLPLNKDADHHTFTSKPLPLGEYEVWVETECARFNSKVHKVKLTKGDGASVNVSNRTLDFCHGFKKYTSQTGTIGVELRIDGFVPNQTGGKVVLESGPSNVGVPPEILSYRYRWFNMLPGDYVARYEACGKVIKFPFNVPNDNSLLKQSIVSEAISSCGDKGKIVSKVEYNHYFPKSIELVDENDEIVKINGVPQTGNTTGTFVNVPPGKYRTRIKVMPHCTKGMEWYYVYNDAPLVIVDGSQNPVFVDAQGVACEDLTGKVESNGTIYLGLAAPSGATLHYRKKGTTAWINHVYSPNVTLTGLAPGDIYEFKLESCGKTATKEVKVEKLLPVIKKGVKHPCKDAPYTLKLPHYQGAIYSWSKASDGVVLGKGNILYFPKFTEADNGIYICKLQWGSCVTREVRYKLDASKCNQELTEVVSGTVYNDDNENGKIDGTPIDKVDTKPLYIQVVKDNEDGTYTHTNIIKKVENNGSFVIDGLATEKKYRLILTTSPTAVNTASAIPSWSFVGEATGDQTYEVDGTADGMLDILAGDGDQMDLRFGVKKQKSPAVLRSNRHITTKL